jgi:hypothetical protein
MADPNRFGNYNYGDLDRTRKLLSDVMENSTRVQMAKVQMDREKADRERRQGIIDPYMQVLQKPDAKPEDYLKTGLVASAKAYSSGDEQLAQGLAEHSKTMAQLAKPDQTITPFDVFRNSYMKINPNATGVDLTEAWNKSLIGLAGGKAQAIQDTKPDALDKKISERIGADNIKYLTMQRPDGTTYETKSGEVRQPALGTVAGQGFGDLSQTDKDAWFEIYRTSGTLPPMAYRDVASRDAFTKGLPDYLRRQGITPTDAVVEKATMGALKGSLAYQQKSYNQMGSFANNIDSQIKKVEGLYKDVLKRVGTRALDMPIREWKTRFVGSGQERVLESYLMEISREIGKLSTGSQASIAELSVEAQAKWDKIHDPNLSFNELIEILNATRDQAKLRIASVKEELGKTKTEMRGMGGNSAKNQSTQPTTQSSAQKTVIKKGYNPTTNQTQFIYNDGTSEIVDGKR